MQSDYDLGPAVREEIESDLGGDQEYFKCLLVIGSQERTVKVIRSSSTLALIWNLCDLDVRLLEREPNCNYPGRRC